MEKRFVSLGHWVDKATGTPMSRLAEISSGISKQSQPYEIADTESREMVEGTYPVGTILTATMNLTVQEHPEAQKGLKLGTSK